MVWDTGSRACALHRLTSNMRCSIRSRHESDGQNPRRILCTMWHERYMPSCKFIATSSSALWNSNPFNLWRGVGNMHLVHHPFLLMARVRRKRTKWAQEHICGCHSDAYESVEQSGSSRTSNRTNSRTSDRTSDRPSEFTSIRCP
jgi:hypothetical protein